jgi:predicted Zn-dependent protease
VSPGPWRESQEVDDVIATAHAKTVEGADDESVRLLQRAVERHPDNALLCLLLAQSYFAVAERDQVGTAMPAEPAIKCLGYLEATLEKGRDDQDLLTRAAQLLLRLDHVDVAHSALSRAAQVIVPAEFAFVHAFTTAVAELALARGGYEGFAEDALRRAFEDDPTIPTTARILAQLLHDQGRSGEAYDVVATALASGRATSELVYLQETLRAELSADRTPKRSDRAEGSGHERVRRSRLQDTAWFSELLAELRGD